MSLLQQLLEAGGQSTTGSLGVGLPYMQLGRCHQYLQGQASVIWSATSPLSYVHTREIPV